MTPRPWLARLGLRLPLRGWLMGPPLISEGQTLDRQLQWVLWLDEQVALPALTQKTVAEARASFRQTGVLFAPRVAGVEVDELSLQGPAGSIACRRYRPRAAPHIEALASGPGWPTLLYFHGGGWTVGDLDTHDGVCRAFAAWTPCQVISVAYSLAPEHPFPAPVEDAWAAYRQVRARASELEVDPRRLAVGGDSAGGNLSAVVSRRARDAGVSGPCLQLLLYPGCDNSRNHPSVETYADGFLLTKADIDWFRARYLPDLEQRREPDASPLLAEDLRGLAPACVITAGFDPLRDEGRRYAERLAAAGVDTQNVCLHDQVHGFLNLAGDLASCRRGFERACEALRVAFVNALA